MALLTSYQQWQRLRKTRKDGDLLLREAKRGLVLYKTQLSDNARSRISGAVASYEAALGKCGDPAQRAAGLDELTNAVSEIDRALDDNLSFARKSTAREYIEAIGTAILIALFLRAFVVEAFKIPSGSMIPTLQVGDHIFVNKFLYGVRIPWTNVKIGTSFRKPRRGEVIVFIYPKEPDKDFIKRIVAVEGDTVQMKDGLLFVNNEAVPHREIDASCEYDDYVERGDYWGTRQCSMWKETVNGVEYSTNHAPGADGHAPLMGAEGVDAHNTQPFTVPPHAVFCEGDNRDNSHDSRWWGIVPEELIKGKAMVIWWSQGRPVEVAQGAPLAFVRNNPIVQTFVNARYWRMFHLVR